MAPAAATAGRPWDDAMATALSRLQGWWSLRLFPGSAASGLALTESRRQVLLRELILLVTAGLLCFTHLNCPLQEPEETLYAEVPRQMLAADRVLVPVRHGQAYYDKPPLLYWLVMAVYGVCGVHDWAARLVPCTAAFLCVLVTYAWGKRLAGPRAAFAGAMMLALSPRWAQMARMLTTNGLLTLWVIAALAAAHYSLASGAGHPGSAPRIRTRWWLLSAVACGLGLLTKGPIAGVLILMPVLIHAYVDPRSARVNWRSWLAYAVIAVGMALPWFIVVALRDPVFLDYFVWTHHVRRFLDPIDHPQPFWYYGPVLLMGMLPWTLLLPGFVKHVVTRTSAVCEQRTGAVGFFLLAGICGVAFFSASGCKRPSYILPAMPALALALGCYADAASRIGRAWFACWAGTATAMFLLLLAAAQWLLPAYAAHYSLRDQLVPHAPEVDRDAPVMCYPHGWDAVPFYLQRGNVRVFRPAQLPELIAELAQQQRSLVIVKSDESLTRFRQALPASLEFVCSSCEPTVAVGWVRRR
jgi:4-amino-4-deoxy-L-arabinose transferase-like glycosyltransferase